MRVALNNDNHLGFHEVCLIARMDDPEPTWSPVYYVQRGLTATLKSPWEKRPFWIAIYNGKEWEKFSLFMSVIRGAATWNEETWVIEANIDKILK